MIDCKKMFFTYQATKISLCLKLGLALVWRSPKVIDKWATKVQTEAT